MASGRNPVYSVGGLVAGAHPAVSFAGAAVLRDGGTAVDAALAMAAMSFVVLPGQCGVGGDAFAVLYDARTGSYRSVQGSGFGPDGADAAFFAERGLAAIPLGGPLSVAVPGAMACIAALHAAAATRSLEDLWRPAIDMAREGFAMTAKTAGDIADQRAALSNDAAAAAVFLPGGGIPAVGARFIQPDLADTLARLAKKPDDIYRGTLAQQCLGALRAGGAPFSGAEWTETAAVVEPTVTANYRGLTVHTGSPPAAGYMLLAQAGVLDGLLAELPWLSAEAVHWMAETAARAFGDRLAVVGSDSTAWRGLLDPSAWRRRRAEINAGAAPPAVARRTAHGDTTSFVAVDRHGNAVSFIHSLALTFGAGLVVPGTGVLLNNRLGRGAYLRPGHPNAVAPRRKPMHTLLAWIAAGGDGVPRIVGNTPGGDGQIQWNMQLLSHVADHDRTAQEAVEAPRFTVFPGSDAHVIGSAPELVCESRLGSDMLSALERRGHPVRRVGPFAGGGGAQLIVRDPGTGALCGGSDPRQDGCALGA